ncbi:cbb3-type cytochrome c oxidase subunit I [Halosimplex halobium]|uniref:cbb3-type cytochrome c oxidase subunit I n=1 Tax=Halosimplex halobium TaxID=3396618 RepID=UPI003F553990
MAARSLAELVRSAARTAHGAAATGRRWLTSVDHADVGRRYLALATVAGLWGAVDAMALRTELLTPGRGVWSAATYDAFFTTHGLTMLFFAATPAAFGFATLVVPPLVGADDVAFPRLSATAFWLLPPALLLARAGAAGDLLGIGGLAPPAVGWTLYVPLSRSAAGAGLDLLLVGLHLAGVSTVLAAITLIVTVLESRTVGWHEVDAFTWSVLTASGLVVFAFPVLGSALVMLLLDRNLGTTFFAVSTGGPVRWQHLFWFFGHPEVYVLGLPALGLISHILPQYAGRRLVGFRGVVYSTLAIGVLSFGVWAHHMFTTGIDPRLAATFMAVSLAIAAPSAIKVFDWLATLWGGEVVLAPPMLFTLAAVANFVLGGVTGVFLAAVPVDRLFHGTYYVVGHFHLVLVGTVVFALFAASYHWFPVLTGRRYDRRLARAHFWLTAGGAAVAFLAMLALGLYSLPRRTAAYPPALAPLHAVATLGAYVMGVGQVVWVWNVAASARRGGDAAAEIRRRARAGAGRVWERWAERDR